MKIKNLRTFFEKYYFFNKSDNFFYLFEMYEEKKLQKRKVGISPK